MTSPTHSSLFATMVHQANVGMAAVDLTGRFVFVNRRYCEITGRSERELLELRMQDITHPEDLLRNVPLFERCITKGQNFTIEKRYRRPDGSDVWVENSVSVLSAPDGTPEFVLAVSLDISGRRATEGALRDSEERYRLVGRATNDVIWDWDHRTGLVVWSESLASVFGYTPAEATGPIDQALGWWSGHIHPDERDEVLASFLAATRGAEERWGKEYRFLGADGSYRTVIDRGYIARNERGEPVRMVGSMQDISALREAQERLRFAQEYGGVATWSWDVPSARLDVDAQFERLYGAAPGSMRTYEDWARRLEPAWLAECEAARDRALAEGGTFEVEFPVRQDGKERWLLARGRAEHDEAGRPVRVLGVNVDITDRKRSEAALSRSEARLRVSEERLTLALRGGEVGAWETDLQTGQTVWREGMAALLGLPEETANESQLWTELIHPDDRADVLRTLAEAAEAGQPWSAEFRVVRADRAIRWLTCRGAAVTLPDGRRRMIGVAQDTTERRAAEQKLREADRQKDAFIAVLAHELRNPLAPMRTAVGILRNQGPEDPLLARCRSVLDRQITQMARLLDDLLDVSRLSRGKLNLQRAPVLLQEVIDAAVETSRPVMDQHRQELRVEGLDEPVLLEADLARLVQVFGNILNNASKFSDPGATIHLSVARDAQGVTVRVRDAGSGIAPEFIGRVFDLFTQAEGAQNRASGGLGIGLWLARRIVEMHGGSIEATSPGPALGSEFIVRLPALQAESRDAADSERTPFPADPLRRRVLVADDNVDSADMVAALLGSIGCEVRAVYNGQDAVREAERFGPQIVLLDIGMPLMDGYEVCRRIRRESWGRQLTIVAITGWGQEEDRRRVLEAGFDVHLVKPVDPEALMRLVGSAESR